MNIRSQGTRNSQVCVKDILELDWLKYTQNRLLEDLSFDVKIEFEIFFVSYTYVLYWALQN